MDSKPCKICGQTKPLSEYHRGACYKDGHFPTCKPCRSVILKMQRPATGRVGGPAARPADERFMEKIVKQPGTGCWLWTGTVGKKGRISFSPMSYKTVSAMRFIYLREGRTIPPRTRLSRRCGNTRCLNPDHFALVRLGIPDKERGVKECSLCRKEVPFALFSNNQGYLSSRCNPCQGVYLRAQKFGLMPEDYLAMLTSQGGRCAICKGLPPGKRGFAVDHDHQTGRIRALLCVRCNTGLGHFMDNADLLRAGAAYLDAHCGTTGVDGTSAATCGISGTHKARLSSTATSSDDAFGRRLEPLALPTSRHP